MQKIFLRKYLQILYVKCKRCDDELAKTKIHQTIQLCYAQTCKIYWIECIWALKHSRMSALRVFAIGHNLCSFWIWLQIIFDYWNGIVCCQLKKKQLLAHIKTDFLSIKKPEMDSFGGELKISFCLVYQKDAFCFKRTHAFPYLACFHWNWSNHRPLFEWKE